MRVKRWELHATPLHYSDRKMTELSVMLAETINEDPDRFIFRWSARSAAKFYSTRSYLPVEFIVRRIEGETK